MIRDAATDPRPWDFCAPAPVTGGLVSPEVDSLAYDAAVDAVDDGTPPLAASDAAVQAGLPWRSPASSKATR